MTISLNIHEAKLQTQLSRDTANDNLKKNLATTFNLRIRSHSPRFLRCASAGYCRLHVICTSKHTLTLHYLSLKILQYSRSQEGINSLAFTMAPRVLFSEAKLRFQKGRKRLEPALKQNSIRYLKSGDDLERGHQNNDDITSDPNVQANERPECMMTSSAGPAPRDAFAGKNADNQEGEQQRHRHRKRKRTQPLGIPPTYKPKLGLTRGVGIYVKKCVKYEAEGLAKVRGEKNDERIATRGRRLNSTLPLIKKEGKVKVLAGLGMVKNPQAVEEKDERPKNTRNSRYVYPADTPVDEPNAGRMPSNGEAKSRSSDVIPKLTILSIDGDFECIAHICSKSIKSFSCFSFLMSSKSSQDQRLRTGLASPVKFSKTIIREDNLHLGGGLEDAEARLKSINECGTQKEI
ncbi:uncharacterized protein BDR25DRAFT_355079 [Lindgomyces ingoldianus]|uniref:Uncharacterized protein n=1 Tax=Lindgomyces ingoldianus TaxID=673940 RepID=A0ACB6QU94_9PLEO|nr:uncharacterized protein BDR25DRAFT_355079 [Lindgomyces ingoldianus]KAF2470589.1 hypothetical protein BDR25DRAFT_355079 [Lindgomyces ingoldianus]